MADAARNLDFVPQQPEQPAEEVARLRKESATELKDYLGQMDRPEKKELKSAVREAAKFLRAVWGKSIKIRDIYIEKFGDNTLGESTPGYLEDGIMIHPDLLHPAARMKLIETLIHEGNHVFGEVDGEDGETLVRTMTKQYSDMVQSAGYENMVNALEQMVGIWGGEKLKTMSKMATMYVNEPKSFYSKFIEKYCAANDVSKIALVMHRNDLFSAEGIFSRNKDGHPISDIAEAGHELFATAFPELAKSYKQGSDGGMHWSEAEFEMEAANDNEVE